MPGYRLFIWIYPKLIGLASLVNPKARLWTAGRKHVFLRLIPVFSGNTRPVIWLHAASLGEFEQGLPVLEKLRELYPSHRILVSFFSPSGYEIRKDHPAADDTCYLPMDSPANAKRFLDIVKPSLVIFVKYEFWLYYLKETNGRGIPLLLVSGIFRKEQAFFKWYGKTHRAMLSCFTTLFVQNQESVTLLASIGLGAKTIQGGDTRFDRVLEIAGQFAEIPAISDFCKDHPVLVAGSTWTDDDEELDHYANTHPDIRFIIAPHDIGEDRLQECSKLYKHSIRYSDWITRSTGRAEQVSPNVMIIDNIGMLSKLYHYASIAYVGGGFGDEGIHNILEPAVYGKPVIFGPIYDKYFEAEEMLDKEAAFTVDDALELEAVITQLLQDTSLLQKSGEAAKAYVKSHAGATGKVISYIQANRLLIN